MTRRLSLTIVSILLLATPASARLVLSTGAGVFEPWQGSTGYELDAAMLATIGQRQNWRVGAEFSYRRAESRILRVNNIEFHSYRLSFVAHYRFLVREIIEPYIGLRLSVAVNSVNDEQIERGQPTRRVSEGSGGVGAAGIVGLDVPFGDHFAIYSEVSLGADVLWLHNGNNDDDWDLTPYVSEGIGGVSGVAGIRVRF